MLKSTIRLKKGINHKSCGKGKGVSFDKDFYNRWQSMRTRTSINSIHRKQYYDRGINSNAFASFIDFYNAMYSSWVEHVERYGAENTSLERIDVDKSYTPENCKWIRFNEQKDNMQKTIYFKVEDLGTGKIEYYKNANRYAKEHNLKTYVAEVINKNGIYKGKKYTRITKEEYNQYTNNQ